MRGNQSVAARLSARVTGEIIAIGGGDLALIGQTADEGRQGSE
jgi:hypothetical protein